MHKKKNKEQHKKHILESAVKIKFTCKLYLVASYILLNWKSIYHSTKNIFWSRRPKLSSPVNYIWLRVIFF